MRNSVKRIFSLLLAALLVLPLFSCTGKNETDAQTEAETTAETEIPLRETEPLPNTILTEGKTLKHTVIFLGQNGEILSEQTVQTGGNAVPPAAPNVAGYKFLGWIGDTENVRCDLTLRARYLNVQKPGEKCIDVTAKGIVANDESAAAKNAKILQELTASPLNKNHTLWFPHGTYYISENIYIQTAGLTLWGDDVTWIRTGVPNTCNSIKNPVTGSTDWNWAGMLFIGGSDTTVRGITFDYAVPTAYTGIVTAVNGNKVTVKLTDGQSALFTGKEAFTRIDNYDKNLDSLGTVDAFNSTETGTPISNVTTDADGVKSFTLSDVGGAKVGDYLAMACCTAYCPAFTIYGDKTVANTVFEDVTLAGCFGMGFIAGMRSENLTLTRVVYKSRNPDNILSCNIDGIHACGIGGKITLKDCYFRGLGDDILNESATAGIVSSVDGEKITLASAVSLWHTGDKIAFYSSALKYLGEGTVAGITGNYEVSGITCKDIPEHVGKNAIISNRTLHAEVEISGCVIRATRARGVLIQSSKRVRVSDTVILGTRLAAILIAPSIGNWNEMEPVCDAEIRNCTFVNCCHAGTAYGAVTVRTNHDKDDSNYVTDTQKNVTVRGCTFLGCPASGVHALCTTGLAVADCVFEDCGGALGKFAVKANNCADIFVSGNTVRGGALEDIVKLISCTGENKIG